LQKALFIALIRLPVIKTESGYLDDTASDRQCNGQQGPLTMFEDPHLSAIKHHSTKVPDGPDDPIASGGFLPQAADRQE
jgi:hypothetical protein